MKKPRLCLIYFLPSSSYIFVPSAKINGVLGLSSGYFPVGICILFYTEVRVQWGKIMGNDRGFIYVFTGEGKGKTTAAIGQAVRSVGQGWKVLIIQFIKQIISGEVEPLKKLGIEIYPMGMGYVGILTDQKEKEIHIQVAEKAFDFAKKKVNGGSYDLLILDEINNSVQLGLLDVSEVIDFLKTKPEKLSVIITGRGAPKEFVEIADLVSEIKDIKHPYEKGAKAKKGIEF